MSDASYPAVGLQVDYDDFAGLDNRIVKSIEAYGRLYTAAEKASKVNPGAAAERSQRVAQQAADAQLMSVNRIMAAQRGLASYQAQQDAATLRTNIAMAKQQVQSAEQAAKGEATARAKSLADFRRMMNERITLGRQAASAEIAAAESTFALRKRLNAQQASETARRLSAESAAAAKAEKEASDAAAAAARERERAAAYVHRLKVQYFIDEQRAQEKADREAVRSAERAAKDQAAAAAAAARAETSAQNKSLSDFRQMMAQRVSLGRAAAKEDEAIAQSTLEFRRRMNAQRAKEEAAASAAAIKAARDQADYLARAAAVRSRQGAAAIITKADVNLFDAARNAMSRFGAATEGIRNGLHRVRVAFFDLRTIVALFLGGLIVGPIVKFADAMTALEARIGFFAKSQADVPYLFEAVYDSAQRARAPLEAVGKLYTRLAPMADQLGKSQLQLLRITETVQKGIAIGGATGAEATSSAQQLAQALASNRLGGDELRSLAENAPILLSAIARELNMNSGEFIKWAHAGKANAQVVVDALERAGPRIDAIFAKFPVTISQGMTVVNNAVQKFVGEVNRITGASAAVGQAMVDFSKFVEAGNTIEMAAKGLMLLGDAFRLVGSGIDFLVKSLPALAVALTVVAVRAGVATVATSTMASTFAATAAIVGRSSAVIIVAQTAVTSAAVRMAAGVRAAFAFFGGPLGVGITAAAIALNGFSNSAKAAAESSAALKTTQDGAVSAIERAIAYSDTYGASTESLSQALVTMTGASIDGAGASLKAGDAHDQAMKRAQQRALVERSLTVDILRRAAADASGEAGRATAAVEGVFGLRNRRNLVAMSVNSSDKGVRDIALREVTKLDSQIAQTMSNAAVQSSRSAQLSALAAQVATTKPVVTVPSDTGGGGGGGGATADDKKTASERLAERLQREADAQNAVIAGNLALAKAYGISEAAALRQIATTEATSRAIKKQGDIDEFVRRQMAENASEAAAAAAKEVFDTNARIAAQNRANAAVRAGLATTAQAQERMEIEAELAPMIAQMDAASGEAKEALRRKIIELAFARQADNAAVKEGQLLAEQEGQRDDLAMLDRQISLIGASNRERAVELAMLAKRQELIANGKINQPDAEAVISGAGAVAGKQVDLAEQTRAYNDSLSLQADLLAQIADQARAAGSGLVDAFGQGAEALAGLLEVMTAYDAKQAAIAQARKAYTDEGGKDAQRLAMFDRDAAQASVQRYGDMAGAAKKLFSERSRGYQVLSAAEKAFRVFEFAMSAKSIAVKTVETAAKIGLFGAQAQAAAAAGAANMFATMGPAGFAAVAAMVAVLAGFGVALSGGSGGSVPGATDMADRQAAQGAGSVLGDAEAKSQSLSRALEIVAANSNKDLEYSNAMLKALQAIESGIGAVAAGLARSLGVGGALSTDKLNLGQTAKDGTLLATVLGGVAGFVLSKIMPDWFGTKTTRTLQDQGLQFGSQSLGDIMSGGIDGQTYQQVLENTKKKFLGITYSDKNKVSTTTGALDADFTSQITSLIGSLRGAVLEGANILGVQGAGAVLDSFQVNLGKLSFKDMTGAEIQEALNAIFSKLGDDLAATAIPALKDLQKVGEGAFETLARVSRNYVVLNTALESIGMTFGAVGVASLEAREYLIDMAGGIEKLTEQTAYFAENFLSDLERMAPIQKAVTAELARLGLQGITTKDQFKNLVLGLDLSTQAGADMYAALMALAPAFAKVVDFATEGSQAVQDARNALSKAYERERSALQATIDKFAKLAQTLKEFRESLTAGPLASNSRARQYALTRQSFLDTAALARTGDADAMGALPAAGRDFLEASKNYSVTLLDYQRDLSMVRNAVEEAEKSALAQVSIGEQQLEALNAQVAALITINESVLTVAQAIAALQAAMAAQTAAILAAQQQAATQPPAANNNTPPSAQAGTIDWSAYLANNPDVAAEYARNMASEKGRNLLSSMGIDSGEEFAERHYSVYGKGEGRTVPLVRDAATASMANANDNGSLAKAISEVGEKLDDLKTATEYGAMASGKTAKILTDWNYDGQPGERNVALP